MSLLAFIKSFFKGQPSESPESNEPYLAPDDKIKQMFPNSMFKHKRIIYNIMPLSNNSGYFAMRAWHTNITHVTYNALTGPNPQKTIPTLTIGESVALIHDTTLDYDAVRVYTHNGKALGFIDEHIVSEILPFLNGSPQELVAYIENTGYSETLQVWYCTITIVVYSKNISHPTIALFEYAEYKGILKRLNESHEITLVDYLSKGRQESIASCVIGETVTTRYNETSGKYDVYATSGCIGSFSKKINAMIRENIDYLDFTISSFEESNNGKQKVVVATTLLPQN